ncbi:MAG: roadblock/LC7 domain-containing protein [Dehalococcoidales bacterium]|nr:roadblock/LC7 domain-containing protein [Dehalococcoidales bacterium]
MDQVWSKLTISPTHLTNISTCLDNLSAQSNICAMVLHSSGQVISSQGELPDCDLGTLGVLLAGNFATARETAKLLREPEFKSLFLEGKSRRLFSLSVGKHWMLSVVFGPSIRIGLIKSLCLKVAKELELVLRDPGDDGEVQGVGVDQEFRESALTAIDLIFREAP